MRNTCSICEADLPTKDWALDYPGVVCEACERRAKGKGAEPFDPGAAPEIPWFVDGHACWWRSRGDGAGNMLRDYADVGDFRSFLATCVAGDWGTELHRKAREALARGAPIPEAFGKKASTAYRGTDLVVDGEGWAACVGSQVPSAARMLDTAVAFTMSRGARCGVAVLQPPLKPGKHHAADRWFVARYQAAAWQAFDIAFVQEPEGATPDTLHHAWRLLPRLPLQTAFLNDLEAMVRGALGGQAIPEDFVHESRDAEAVVRPVVHRILREQGYRHTQTGYESMWRGASTDGSWENERASCRRIALEVKFGEDIGWPLCQPLDYFGAGHEAVVQVRLVNPSVRRKISQQPPALREAVAAATRRLPFRSIEIDV
jgi:hypothetical protein